MPELSKKVLTDLKGIGLKVEQKFHKLGIFNCQDLLFHLPNAYEDKTFITPIVSAQNGQKALIQATIQKQHIAFSRKGRSRRMLIVNVHDDEGQLNLRFFHFNASQQQQLKADKLIRCFGEIVMVNGLPEMIHPEYKIIDEENPPPLENTLTPVYGMTEGLQQRSIRQAVNQVLEWVNENPITDLLPHAWLCEQQLPDLNQALKDLHCPQDKQQSQLIQSFKHPAQTRLIMEELAVHYLLMQQKKLQHQKQKGPKYQQNLLKLDQFESKLPFKLTQAQRRVCNEITDDFSRKYSMQRLLQGDVGSGKTVVAAYACLHMILQGYQAILMAPTEILAEQHLTNFRTWFADFNLNIVFLTGSDKGKKRAQKELQIEEGSAAMIIGTHALFHTQASFKNPAIVVIDEQHRFGVEQRKILSEKGLNKLLPHNLIMTATPIPRTLAMSVYADLDYSQIDELPPGRKAVTTSVVSEKKREQLIQSILKACKEGKQTYWVCTLIEESETLQCKTAEETYAVLFEALKPFSVGLIHGRMKASQKENIIQQFKSKSIQVLVATTVIEVGVDVPNASIMVIENAERLGLSQIHQLRGRVGRGSVESYCIMLVSAQLSNTARQRLDILRKSNDGFEIAEKDLEIRGAGEIIGTKQSGGIEMKIADLSRDRALFSAAQNLASLLQKQSKADVVDQIIRNWVGRKSDFSNTA